MSDPGGIAAIPVDRGFEPLLEWHLRLPSGFARQLLAREGIAAVVPGTVGHGLHQRARLAHGIQDALDHFDVGQLRQSLATHRPKFVILTPNYQNPTGITYTDENRHAIASVMQEHNTLLVEDDPYSELGFTNKHVPTLRAYLGQRAIVLGSFSKIVAPGMRLGWLIAPKEVMAKVIIAKQATDFHSSNFAQRVLHQYLISNPIDDHIARIQAGYAAQCRAMIGALERYLPPGIQFTRPDGGMFVWVTLPSEADSLVILRDAIASKVSFLPGVPFFTDGDGKRYLRLSYSMCNEATIDEGVRRLAQVVIQHLDPAPA